MSVSGPGRVIDNGLVLYLDASNNKSFVSGSNTWFDVSRNGNNITLTNGPTFNSENAGSIAFDSTNDYGITTLNSTPALNFTSQVSIAAWLNASFLADSLHGDGIVSKGLSADNNGAIYELLLLPSSSANYPYFRVRAGSSSPVYYPTTTPLNTNNVYNVVGTYDGSTLRIFVNGEQVGTGSAASGAMPANTEQLTVGVRYRDRGGGFNSFFAGRIYSALVYNRALSASEILQNYNLEKKRFGL